MFIIWISAKMNTRAAKKKREKVSRLKIAVNNAASGAKRKKLLPGFDVNRFLKNAEVEDRKSGRDTMTQNGNTASYTKSQVAIERRFLKDLAENYGEL